MAGEDQIRVLELAYGEDYSCKVFRLKKGWRVCFSLDPILQTHSVRMFCNHPVNDRTSFQYSELKWDSEFKLEGFNEVSEVITLSIAGSFNFFYTVDGSDDVEKALGSGYFIVDPELEISTEPPTKFNLDSLQIHTDHEIQEASTISAEAPEAVVVQVLTTQPDVCDGEMLAETDKHYVIQNRIPPDNFLFPATVIKEARRHSGNSRRYCNHGYFSTYSTLTYSYREDSVYCLPCALFPYPVATSFRKIYFVSKGFRDWKKLHEKYKKHLIESAAGHNYSIEAMEAFLHSATTQSVNFMGEDDVRADTLKTLVSSLLYLAGQGSAIRLSEHDRFELPSTEEDSIEDSDSDMSPLFIAQRKFEHEARTRSDNLEKLTSLIKLCTDISDEQKKSRLKAGFSDIRPNLDKIQNDLLKCILDEIEEQIRNSVVNQRGRIMFSVLAHGRAVDLQDEWTQGVSIRYIDENNTIQELPIGFSQQVRWSKENIGKEVLYIVRKLELDPTKSIGLGLDNLGDITDAEVTYQAECPEAVLFHCSSQPLILHLTPYTTQVETPMMIDSLRRCGEFYNKREPVLEIIREHLEELNKKREEEGKELISFDNNKMFDGPTWYENLESLEDFFSLYPVILKAMCEISNHQAENEWLTNVQDLAYRIQNHIKKDEFLMAFATHLHLCRRMNQVSKGLQGNWDEVYKAYSKIPDLITLLKEERLQKVISDVYQIVMPMCEATRFELKKPQRGREPMSPGKRKADGTSPESPIEYYTRFITHAVYDHVIKQMEKKFTERALKYISAVELLPHRVLRITEDNLVKIKQAYSFIMLESDQFDSEVNSYKILVTSWDGCPSITEPNYAAKVLERVPIAVFPNLHHILKALFTFPISKADRTVNCNVEFIKTCNVSVMGPERFNVLALLACGNEGYNIDSTSIVHRYSGEAMEFEDV